MDEYDKYLQSHIDTCSRDDIDTGRRAMLDMALSEYRAFKAKAVEVEPLACLAERKGKILHQISCYWINLYEWHIFIAEPPRGENRMPFNGKNYAAAEAKARAYLNSLPDKEAKP